jgi:cytidyltransferase-like protein
MTKIVVASGYFDPLHIGHIEYLNRSKNLGDKLIVIVNSDYQAKLKKGESFMSEGERLKIIRELRCVDGAVISVDKDRTVKETLKSIRPDIFTNGGDQHNSTIPEREICEELDIILEDGLGDKIQSSSWLISGIKNTLNIK